MSGRSVLYGAMAGAAGTSALNATTYLDMAMRGRPPSEVPKKMVKELANRSGIAQLEENRERAFSALVGYVDGVGSGALFGLIRPAMKDVSWFWAGLALGAFTGLMSEGVATAMGQTDPRKWGVAGWLADIVPRAVYGWTAAVTYDELMRDSSS